MTNEVKKRYVKPKVQCELWGRAAGRCQFDGCNRLVFKSPVTQERVNISEMAHIYSFSKNGPRGWGPFIRNLDGLNDTGNLMLVCHDCHKKLDKKKNGGRYKSSLLIKWKEEHEKRIKIVTSVDPSKKSYVILYGANIGEEESIVQPEHAKWALFPDWYPAEERPVTLDMTWEGKDEEPTYWSTEESNLVRGFRRKIRPLISDGRHFSIFGFAPMPLLIRLGTLFTDKVPSQIYQFQREPEQTWMWSDETYSTNYTVVEPESFNTPPVLIISLSAKIAHERVTSVVGTDVSIWELTINQPHNDFLKSIKQLSEFREVSRNLMVRIAEIHGIKTPMSIFPSMPLACAVDFGRIRMPKAEMPWVIYDQNNRVSAFVRALEIGGHENE